ncbi:MAG: hypothetical protein M3O67_00775, partial [Bacteroidota bacterium]|nr:hypothetical protein [Bacteroidota bacterium]
MNDSMYKGLLYLHSFGRWLLLLLLVLAFFRSLSAGNRPFTTGDKKIGLFTLIVADIMLLIGLLQWYAGPWGWKLIDTVGMSEVMKNPVQRFFAIEHSTGMVVAIIMIHIGKSYAKKNIPDKIKHRRTVVFFGLALLIILVSIPWPFR